MTLYAIFVPHDADRLPEAVPQRFSWGTAVLPPIWLLRHGLWLETLGWAVVLAGLVFAAGYVGGGAAFWLYVLFATWLGCAAPSLRRHALRRRGWYEAGHRVALTADLAQLGALR